MTRKKAGKSTPKEIPFGNVQFVINNLSQAELDAMDADERFQSGETIVLRAAELIEAGWKISSKWDYRSEAIQVTMLMLLMDHPNAGFAVSARSDDFLDALRIVVYKHDVVADGTLSAFAVSSENVRG
jgi:hypothetical protein